MTEKTEFGVLVDCSDEEFKKHCEGKNIGYVTSLRNHIAGVYQTFVEMKKDLIEKVKADNLGEDSEEVKTIKGIFAELLKLEHKALLCNEIINGLQLSD